MHGRDKKLIQNQKGRNHLEDVGG